MMKYKPLLPLLSLIALCLAATVSIASIEVREFSSDEQRSSYYALTKELRCPKCQNQDIADSNAPIAQDMRRQVHRLIEEGKSHDQVVAYMVERFGEFVTYKPKVSRETAILWYGPWVLMMIGAVVVILLARKARRRQPSGESDVSNPDPEDHSGSDSIQSSKVKELLNKYSDE